MLPWTTIPLVVAGLGAAALWAGRRSQQRQSASLIAALEESGLDASLVEPESTTELPLPVARYLGHVLPVDRRQIRCARYRQAGSLRTDARGKRWFDFTAREFIAPAAASFVWEADVAMLPLVQLQVRDSLLHGRGAGQVALWSALPVASASGSTEMNSGALHRFLAEAVWYPTALLPSRMLRWQAIDESSALATLEHAGTSVSLEFRFNRDDEVAGIHTDGRWGSFDGGYRRLPWEGHFRNYRRRGGMLVPDEGEVGWTIDGVWQKVWQGRVVDAEFEFA